MKTLKKIGFIFEAAAFDTPALPPIREEPYFDVPKICAYLEGGYHYASVPLVERDVFDKTRVLGSPELLTDGHWVWPKTLSYYVSRRSVNLPDEFVEYIRRMKYALPSDVDVTDLIAEGDEML